MLIGDIKVAAYNGECPKDMDWLERGLWQDCRLIYLKYFAKELSQEEAAEKMKKRIERYEINRKELMNDESN